MNGEQVAALLAMVDQMLATRLTDAATSVVLPGDMDACLGAERCAREVVAVTVGGPA